MKKKIITYNQDRTYTTRYEEVQEPTRQEMLDLRRENNINEIVSLKAELASLDYMAIKYAEGLISDVDYSPIKAYRQSLRDRINELEKELNNGNESTEKQEG